MKIRGIIQTYSSVLVVISICLLVAGCVKPPTPPTGEGEVSSYQLEIDLLGTKNAFSIDSQGKLKTNAEISSADGKVSLSIRKGSVVLDKDKKPLVAISVTVDANSPSPPQDTSIISTVYDLKPGGANFDPALLLTLSYDPEKLPEGVRETQVYIAGYDTEWSMFRFKTVDTENHRVTTQMDHLTTKLAVLAPKPAQPTPSDSSNQDFGTLSLEEAFSSGKPTLAEFGSATSPPCEIMKGTLYQLSKEYEGKLNVVLVDIDERKDLYEKYEIVALPTQIFFDGSGVEITRHEGTWSKAQIVAQLAEVGVY